MTRDELSIAIDVAKQLTGTTKGLRAGGVRQLARAVVALAEMAKVSPGPIPDIAPADVFVWLESKRWGRVDPKRMEDGWRGYVAPILDDHGRQIVIALPEDAEMMPEALRNRMPLLCAVSEMTEPRVLAEMRPLAATPTRRTS